MSYMLGPPDWNLEPGIPFWWYHDNGWQSWSITDAPVIKMRFHVPTKLKNRRLVPRLTPKQVRALWWRGPPFGSYVVLPGLIRWRDVKAAGSRDRSSAPSNIQWQHMRGSLPA